MMLIGWLIERSDAKKEEERQLHITSSARRNMATHNYLKKFPESDGWSRVQLEDYRYAYVNNRGIYLNNELFVSGEDFEDGLASVRVYNRGVSLLNAKGYYLIPFESNPLIDTHLKRIYRGLYEYTRVVHFKKDYVDHEEVYLYNSSGTCINAGHNFFSKVLEVKDNYIKVKINQSVAEIDFNGKFLSRPFVEKTDVGNGLFIVRKEDKYAWGVYDANSDRIIIPCDFSGVEYLKPYDIFALQRYSEGQKTFRQYAVNRNNEVVIPPKYDVIHLLDNQYIEVSFFNHDRGCGFKSGIIDIKGKEIVKPIYGLIWPFESGFMVAEYEGQKRCGIVKPDGLSDLEYDSYETVFLKPKRIRVIKNLSLINNSNVDSHKPDLLIVSQKDKVGVIAIDNRVIIPLETQTVSTIIVNESTFFKVRRGSSIGVYSSDGRLIIPISFQRVSTRWDYPDIDYFEAISQDGKVICFDLNGVDYHPKSADELLNIMTPRGQSKNSPIRTEQKLSWSQINTSKDIDKGYYLFFDTETTGLPIDYKAPSSNTHNWPRLVQLSWILTDRNGKHLRVADYIVKPDGFTIPQESSNLHGITTQRAISEGDDLRNVLNVFLMDLKKASYVVGHNVDFDKKIIGAELIRLGETDLIQALPSICTMKAALDYCAIPGKYGFKYPTLQELYKKLFGVEFTDAHNSAFDVESTEKCFWKMKEIGII